MAASSSSNCTDFANHPGVRKTQSGKWGAAILDPTTKRSVWLGSYSTPKEAAEAYTSKKIEYQSISPHKGVTSLPKRDKTRSDHKKFRGVRPTNSGKWGASIRHPVTKANVWLGSHDTPEEAADAYNNKKLEFDLLRTPPSGVYQRKSGSWFAVFQHPITKSRINLGTYGTSEDAEEALERKRHEFSTKRQESDESGEGLKRKREEFGSVVSAWEKLQRSNAEEPSMDIGMGNEGSGSGVVDGCGRLIGEFSRLDDELWLTSSLDEDGDIETQV